FPSLCEGFGLPVLEAMACGTPVVCSNTSSLLEIVGEAALTFDPLDVTEMAAKIEEALRNEALREEMKEKGLQRAAKFSWERTARETLKVYREVAN
ncbi:MAG: glycosyltransferase, partial [Ardenticatenia bacterium]|nr:glycosyltransferase [Ardenticatenia bacterium]